MPAHKNILNGCHVGEAGKLRSCHHNKGHKIKKGEPVLLARAGMGWNGYCKTCGAKMLDEAQKGIEEMRKALDS